MVGGLRIWVSVQKASDLGARAETPAGQRAEAAAGRGVARFLIGRLQEYDFVTGGSSGDKTVDRCATVTGGVGSQMVTHCSL